MVGPDLHTTAPAAAADQDAAGFEHLHCLMQYLAARSEEHTSELQSLMRISYAVFCLKKKKSQISKKQQQIHQHYKLITIKLDRTTQNHKNNSTYTQ